MLLGGPLRPFTPAIKCVCFSLGFDSHDIIDPIIAETARRGNSCSRRKVIRFCASFQHSKHMQSQKNVFSFLALEAEQRIQSPLLLSFDCASALALSASQLPQREDHLTST